LIGELAKEKRFAIAIPNVVDSERSPAVNGNANFCGRLWITRHIALMRTIMPLHHNNDGAQWTKRERFIEFRNAYASCIGHPSDHRARQYDLGDVMRSLERSAARHD
jgi:hypothetical protein